MLVLVLVPLPLVQLPLVVVVVVVLLLLQWSRVLPSVTRGSLPDACGGACLAELRVASPTAFAIWNLFRYPRIARQEQFTGGVIAVIGEFPPRRSLPLPRSRLPRRSLPLPRSFASVCPVAGWRPFSSTSTLKAAAAAAAAAVGTFVFAVGAACAENSIYGVAECDRTGKWSDAVTMLVLGAAAVVFGAAIGSTAFYPVRAAAAAATATAALSALCPRL